jgi:hypothetical protein
VASRPPGWLIWPSAVLMLLAAALRHRDYADAPPTPPPLPAGEAALAEASPLDLVATTRIKSHHIAGAAFSVGDAGLWITTRGVAAHCRRPAIVVNGPGVAAKATPAPDGQLAWLTTTAGAPALPAAAGPLRDAEFAYAAGFPGGRPGEAALRFVSARTLFVRPRGAHGLPVLMWAEAGRTEGLAGRLTPGLVGAPALDRNGAAVGVVLSEAPNRGRIYTTTSEALGGALAAAGAPTTPPSAGVPLSPGNYGLAADDLRRSLRIAAVACG